MRPWQADAARWWAQPRSTCFSPSPAPHPDADFSGTTLYDIIFLNLTLFLFSLLLSLFQAGYLKICLSTLRGEPISVGDMLYAFYHHPDQYVLMFLIINGISSVIALISSIPGFQYLSSPSADLTLGTALSIEAELLL
mgnify:CR=1 FL=1